MEEVDAPDIVAEVAFLLSVTGLQAGDRLFLTAPEKIAEEYLGAAEDAVRDRGAVLNTGSALPKAGRANVLISLDAPLGLDSYEGDLGLLREAASTLQPGGRYLIDLPNREWTVQNHVENLVQTGADGTLYLRRSEFDFVASRSLVSLTAISPGGGRREIESASRRLYTLTELIVLLEAAGLTFVAAFNGFEDEPYGPEAPRMAVLARKAAPKRPA